MTFAPLALALALAQAPSNSTPPKAAPQPPAPPAPVAPAPAPVAPPPLAVTTTLTLGDALRQAGERNFELKVAAARLRQAELGYQKAWAAYLPQVSLGGTYNRYEKDVIFPFPIAARVGGTPTVVDIVDITIIAKNQVQFTADASQVLFSPALWYAIRANSDVSDAARAQFENARRSILYGTAQAYYGMAAFRQFMRVNEALLEVAQRQEKDARVRYQAGTLAKLGLLRAEIDRAKAEQDVQRSRNSYQSARVALAAILDRPADFDVADPEEPKLPGDSAKLVETALQDRQDVRAARRGLDAAVETKRAMYASYIPNVAAFGHYQNANVAGLTGKELWTVGLSAQWKIFDGGLREANVREANARVADAEATLATVESRAKLEVSQALLDLDSARANALKAKEQRDLAAENQRLVDVSYRAGSATAVEQADATTQLRNAEVAAFAETLSAQLAALRVLQAAGADIR